MSRTKIAEVVVFTTPFGVPSRGRSPELHHDGRVIELPQVQDVVARVAVNDVSHVDVTFVATLRYEKEEDAT